MGFFGRLLRFAARGFVVRTDALQIVVAAAAPGLASMLGIELPANASDSLAAYLLLVVLAWATLRLVTAPYFIWKEDQETIRGLEERLGRPGQVRREETARITAQARATFAARLFDWTAQAGTIEFRRGDDAARIRHDAALFLDGVARHLFAHINHAAGRIELSQEFVASDQDVAERQGAVRRNNVQIIEACRDGIAAFLSDDMERCFMHSRHVRHILAMNATLDYVFGPPPLEGQNGSGVFPWEYPIPEPDA